MENLLIGGKSKKMRIWVGLESHDQDPRSDCWQLVGKWLVLFWICALLVNKSLKGQELFWQGLLPPYGWTPALSWVQCGREKNVTGGDADYGENPGDWENHSNHNIFQRWGWKPRWGGWLLASICDIDRCNMEIIHNIQSFEPKTATFIRFKLWHCHLKFLWRAQQWWSWWCSRREKYSAVWGQERH